MPIRLTVFVPPPHPTEMAELSANERLVVQGLRRWIQGWTRRESWHWSVVWNDFAKALGPEPARLALNAISEVVRELAVSARRRFRYAPPCCGILCADELAILSLVAACQRRDLGCGSRLAEWLVQPAGTARLVAAGHEIALVMQAAGLDLPDRQSAVVQKSAPRSDGPGRTRFGESPAGADRSQNASPHL